MKFLLFGLFLLATPVFASSLYKPQPMVCRPPTLIDCSNLPADMCAAFDAQRKADAASYISCLQYNKSLLPPCQAKFSGNGTTTDDGNGGCTVTCADDSYPTTSDTCVLKPKSVKPVVNRMIEAAPEAAPKSVIVSPVIPVVLTAAYSPIKNFPTSTPKTVPAVKRALKVVVAPKIVPTVAPVVQAPANSTFQPHQSPNWFEQTLDFFKKFSSF